MRIPSKDGSMTCRRRFNIHQLSALATGNTGMLVYGFYPTDGHHRGALMCGTEAFPPVCISSVCVYDTPMTIFSLRSRDASKNLKENVCVFVG